MNAAMIYLNPNISKEQADKFYAEYLSTKKSMMDDFMKSVEKLETEEQKASALKVFPAIFMMM